jgi:hypothetical protein
VDKEITLLPEGSFFAWDYRCETRYENGHPAIQPGTIKKVSLHIENSLPVSRTIRFSASIEGCEVEGNQTMVLQPGSSNVFTFSVNASRKLPLYPGQILLERLENSSVWSVETVPFVLFPTRDWSVSIDSGDMKTMYCTNSRIPVETLPLSEAETLTVRTDIYIPTDKLVRLIANCRQPLTMLVDGNITAECAELTAEIPAYHRADRRKCANMTLCRGHHTVEIKIDHANEIKNLFFFVVDPDKYCGAEIGTMMQAPER